MIPCKEYFALKREELKQKIENVTCYTGCRPKLVIFKFGDDPSSTSYIKGISKDCDIVGIDAVVKDIGYDITSEELNFEIMMACLEFDGVMVQAPLPRHIDREKINIPVYADVDGWGKNAMFKPCTPLGVINYLKYNNYDFEGKDICVVGRSEHVGKPLARMLTDLDATVMLCHSKTRNLNKYFMRADLVITAIDKVEYFGREYSLLGNVIDIGLGLNKEGKLKGNLTDDTIASIINWHTYIKDGFIISGTGGVGLLTRLELLNNTYEAFCMRGKAVKYEY